VEIKEPEIIKWLAGAISAIGAWLLKLVWDRQSRVFLEVQKLRKEFHAHQLDVEMRHPTKQEMHEEFKEVKNRLDKIIDNHHERRNRDG